MRRALYILLLLSSPSFGQEPQVRMLARAESLLSKLDTTGAVDVFRDVLNHYPDSYPAALRLTEISYLSDDFKDAIQYSYITEDILNRYIDSVRTRGDLSETDVRRARRYETDLADLHMLKGKIRLKQSRPVDALHELNQALEHTNQPSDVYIDIGLAHISLGAYAQAREAFMSSLSLDRNNKGALFNMGNLYYSMEEYDSARRYYQMTHAHYPALKWPLLYLGNIATFQQEYDSAINYYSEYLSRDSTSQEVYFRRAVLYSELRQWTNAIKDWSDALHLDEADSEAWRNRGLAWFQLEEYEKALADFNQAISLDPEPYTYVNRGYVHYLLRDYDMALKDLNEGMSSLEDYALGYYLRALTCMRLRDREAACENLEQALSNGMTESEVRDRKLKRSCL